MYVHLCPHLWKSRKQSLLFCAIMVSILIVFYVDVLPLLYSQLIYTKQLFFEDTPDMS